MSHRAARKRIAGRTRRFRLLGLSGGISAGLCLLAAYPFQAALAFRQGDMPDFVVSCPFAHRLADDPFVHPG